jgi:hypothetical protein
MSRDSDNLPLTRTPLDIFPVEVWNIILSIVRQAAECYGIPDGTEHARFVTILPVSRAWAVRSLQSQRESTTLIDVCVCVRS